MLPTTQLPVIAVTGMAFEARIAAGPGVRTVYGSRPQALAADLAAAVARGCRGIVSFGIAGGLAGTVRPGTTIVARSIITEEGRFDSHLEWSSRLLQSIPGAIHADLAGARKLIADPMEKAALCRGTGAIAVDMESALCIGAAIAHGLPFAAVRVVADPSHRPLPPAAQIELRADGSPDFPAVLRSVMAKPHQVSALIRVALDTRTARAALVRARRTLGPGFGLIGPMEPALAATSAAAPAD